MDARFLSYRQIRKGRAAACGPEHNRFSLPAAWSALAGVMFVFVLGLLTLGQPALSRYYQNLSLAGNLALLPAALAGVGAAFVGPGPAGGGGRAARRQRGPCGACGRCLRRCWRCSWWWRAAPGTRWAGTSPMSTPRPRNWPADRPSPDPDYFRLCPNNAPPDHPAGRPHVGGRQSWGSRCPFVVLPYLDAVLLNLTAYFTVRCAQRITPSRWARGFAAAVSILWIAMSALCALPLHRYVGRAVSRAGDLRVADRAPPGTQVGAGFAGVLCRRRGQAHGADRAHRAGTARPVPLSGPPGFFRRRVETRAGGAGRARAGRRAGAGVPARVHGIPGGQCPSLRSS